MELISKEGRTIFVLRYFKSSHMLSREAKLSPVLGTIINMLCVLNESVRVGRTVGIHGLTGMASLFSM